jgi:hypothetical protein
MGFAKRPTGGYNPGKAGFDPADQNAWIAFPATKGESSGPYLTEELADETIAV